MTFQPACRIYLSAVLVLCVGLAREARSALKTYVGPPGSGFWNTDANWSPFGFPLSFDDVSITPGDSAGRTVVFNINQPGTFMLDYGSVVIAPVGSGTVLLSNPGGYFGAQSLSVGLRAGYAQQGNVSVVNSTLLNGGSIDVFGGYVSAQNFAMISGWLGTNGGTVTSNGHFNFGGGQVVGLGTVVNNGTLVYNNVQRFAATLVNNGTIVLNSDAAFAGMRNNRSMTLPANRTLAVDEPFFVLRQSGGTFTQHGDVRADVVVSNGSAWDQRGGTLAREFFGVEVGDAQGPGTFYLNDGTIGDPFSGATSVRVGVAGIGTFVQSGGSLALAHVKIADAAAGRGLYTISGGSIFAPSMTIGATSAVEAAFVQTGGETRVNGTTGTLLALRQTAGGSTSLAMSGGTFVVSRANGGSPPAVVANDAAITQSGGTIVFAGELLGDGGVVTLSGTASFRVGSAFETTPNAGRLRQHSVRLSGNAVLTQASPPGAPPAASRVESLEFDELTGAVRGMWDLGPCPLVIDYAGASPVAAVTRYLAGGYGNGNWTGNGLASALAAADAARRTALGVVEAADVGSPPVFFDQPIDATSLLICYTLYGDANLDRGVDIGDFSLLAANFNQQAFWGRGDFNYDGTAGIGDFALLAANFNQALPATPAARGAAAVPEPAAAAPLAAAAASVLAGRRGRWRR